MWGWGVEDARHISESLVSSVQPTEPELSRTAELSSRITPSGRNLRPLHSLDVDALDGLFDIIQEGLALWRVFVLRVVVHIG